MKTPFYTILPKKDHVLILDQRLLPRKKHYIRVRTYRDAYDAIRHMAIRGAPAIGVTAAFGLWLGARSVKTRDRNKYMTAIEKAGRYLVSSRPTAHNLPWAVKRMLAVAKTEMSSTASITNRLYTEALHIYYEDIEANKRMGDFGAKLIKDNSTVLTHCNAGSLATAGYGTALGVLRSAKSAGKRLKVFVDETRPFLQGARLTAWELNEDGFDVTLITDSMAGWMMKQGLINSCIVGADRIAANGDVANKIGTYSVAVLARAHGIPFYVAAPSSTFDAGISSGKDIVIEERGYREVITISDRAIAPAGIKVRNPAFDITPAGYITAIITEKGIIYPPYTRAIRGLLT
ncbi:MAG: S-methyl-5-thioribose-1-phosphate isomerase [Deltaproteobacteria bacterium]|nr:S-methyl-5-thioribose-1-phosphate isomerase [Deltaproteobacteria bacterium]